MGIPGWWGMIYCGPAAAMMNLTWGRGAKGGGDVWIGVTTAVFVMLLDSRGRLNGNPLSGEPFPSLNGLTIVVGTNPGA